MRVESVSNKKKNMNLIVFSSIKYNSIYNNFHIGINLAFLLTLVGSMNSNRFKFDSSLIHAPHIMYCISRMIYLCMYAYLCSVCIPCLSGKRKHFGEVRKLQSLLVALRAYAHGDTLVCQKGTASSFWDTEGWTR